MVSYFKLSIAIFIIVFLLLAISILFKGPIGKALKDMFGVVESAAVLASKQIALCFSKGFFDIKDGCFLGIGILAFGLIKFGSKFLKIFKSGKTDTQTALEEIAERTGKSTEEVLDDILEEIDLDAVDSQVAAQGENMVITGLKKAFNKLLNKFRKQSLEKEDLSSTELKKLETEYDQQETDTENEINEDLDPEEIDETDTIADDIIVE